MWRKFRKTIRYIFIPPNFDNITEYSDGCTGIPEIDNPHR